MCPTADKSPHKCITVATYGHIWMQHLFRASGPHQCSAGTRHEIEDLVIMQLGAHMHSFLNALEESCLTMTVSLMHSNNMSLHFFMCVCVSGCVICVSECVYIYLCVQATLARHSVRRAHSISAVLWPHLNMMPLQHTPNTHPWTCNHRTALMLCACITRCLPGVGPP